MLNIELLRRRKRGATEEIYGCEGGHAEQDSKDRVRWRQIIPCGDPKSEKLKEDEEEPLQTTSSHGDNELKIWGPACMKLEEMVEGIMEEDRALTVRGEGGGLL